MNPRIYYICLASSVNPNNFGDSHLINLPNGFVLLSARYSPTGTSGQDAFESQPDVVALPLVTDSSPLSPAIIQQLLSIGANVGDAMKDIRSKARAIHLLM